MTGSVSSVALQLPEVKSIVPFPMPAALHQPRLAEALIHLVQWAVGDAVECYIPNRSEEADIILCIGTDVAAPPGSLALHAVAGGWYAWTGLPGNLPKSFLPETDSNPLGPFLAASMLASEVFKHSRSLCRGRWLENFGYCLWNGREARWDELPPGPRIANLDLPPLYVVGAGAVGQGLIYILGAAALGQSYIVTIDDDIHDRTNLNRCFLAGVEDVGKHKVEAVKRYRRSGGLNGLEFPGSLSEYLKRSKQNLRADLIESERNDRYRCIVSCVDKGASRQDIQGLWPDLVLGGSTLNLTAKANVYDLHAGTACLGCHNPAERDGEELRKVEQRIRAMSPDEQRAYFSSADNAGAILDYITSGEKCGTIGEAAFRAHATQATKEFSVSFVSMASAILLAARLLNRLVFRTGPEAQLPNSSSLAFLNGSVEHCQLAVDHDCPRCGGDPISAVKNIA
jgi:molybdopterin/thiamine biosynthesis adenylyltransferase